MGQAGVDSGARNLGCVCCSVLIKDRSNFCQHVLLLLHDLPQELQLTCVAPSLKQLPLKDKHMFVRLILLRRFQEHDSGPATHSVLSTLSANVLCFI